MRGWPRQWHCPWHCWYLKCLWRRHDLFDSFWISAVIWCQQHLTPHCICREVWWFAELCFGVVGVAVSSCILGYKESSRRVSDDMGRPLHFRSQSPYLVVSTTCCSLPLMMRMVMMHSLNVFFLMGETCKLKECVGQMLAWNDLTPLLRRTVSGLLFGPPRKVLWRRGAPLTGWWRHSLEWCFFFRWILSKWRIFLDFWVNDVVYQNPIIHKVADPRIPHFEHQLQLESTAWTS